MDTPPVTLGPDEQRRLYVLSELLAGHLSTVEAAIALDVSIRHLQRLKARYRREGSPALVHGNRGRRPWHALDPELAGRVVELARTRYVGLNHSHLADLLAEVAGGGRRCIGGVGRQIVPSPGRPCTRGLLRPVVASHGPPSDRITLAEGLRSHDPRSVTRSR